jgi:hypothetical protein
MCFAAFFAFLTCVWWCPLFEVGSGMDKEAVAEPHLARERTEASRLMEEGNECSRPVLFFSMIVPHLQSICHFGEPLRSHSFQPNVRKSGMKRLRFT